MIIKTLKYLLVSIPFLLVSCSKGGDSTTTPTTPTTPVTPVEAAVAFSINVDPGAGNILGVIGTSQSIIVKVSSAIPAAGVTIATTVTKDADNSSVFTNSVSSLTADNTINITGLTSGALCTVKVDVTSKSTATNTKSLSFKLAAK
jgi:hypothetical protein